MVADSRIAILYFCCYLSGLKGRMSESQALIIQLAMHQRSGKISLMQDASL
jgi:hypothetical protein